MTTVNGKLVNLRSPSSLQEYSLADYIKDTDIIPFEVFDSLEEIQLFLLNNRSGTVMFPRKSLYNNSKYVAYLTANPDPLGVVVLNVTTYSDHHPLNEYDVRPIDSTQWLKGDIVLNKDCTKRYSPTSWLCVESGNPGKWMARGFSQQNYNDIEVVDTLPGAEEYNEGRMVLHRVSSQLSELCYCARVSDNTYEWKSILAYEVEHPPDEEDLIDKFLAYGFPLARMPEFEKHTGPDMSVIYDLRDRLITAEDMARYDQIVYNKVPSYIDDSAYLEDRIIKPTDDLNTLVSGIYYCPYDFSTYEEDTKPIDYPPTEYPIILRVQQFKRIANNMNYIVVLQKAMDVMTGETYSRCGGLDTETNTIVKELGWMTDDSLYEWHQNGNAVPIADLSELIALVEKVTL